VTLDPHKWLYQPFECGAVLVRDGVRLRRAFEMTPDYLKDAMVATGEVNFADLGMQLSRMARAFKIWTSIRYFGLDAFRATIDRTLDLALAAQHHIEASDHLELLLPAHLGIVCFRRRFPGVDDEARLDAMNAALVHALDESGYGLVSSTRLQGHYAIRLCVLNHTSGPRDVLGVLSWLEAHDVPVPADDEVQDQIRAHPVVDRTASPTPTWSGYPHPDPAELANLEAFAGTDESALELLASACYEKHAELGEHVVRRWGTDRDFYVILDGTVEVFVDTRIVRRLGPGDFFGELAAQDWGGGFGYPRLADVVATAPLRLLVVPLDVYPTVAALPGLRDRIRGAFRVRLPES
jgi:hypothetical protein